MEKMDLKACVRSVRDFPKEGVVFRDVTTLFQNPDAFEQLMQEMVASLQGLDVDLVLGPEARGFTVASVLAYALHVTVERHPASRRFWAWAAGATLGRFVDLLQAGADRARTLGEQNQQSPAARAGSLSG